MVTKLRTFLVFLAFSLFAVSPSANGQAFPVAAVTSLAATPTGITAADLNRDGKLDLLFQYPSFGVSSSGVPPATEVVQILIGNGDGTFSPAQRNFLFSTSSSAVFTGDFNGDGITDWGIGVYDTISGNGYSFRIYLGNGDGTSNIPAVTTPVSSVNFSGHIAVADFNGDGKLDIAYSDGTSNLYVAYGDGTGKFINTYTYSASQTSDLYAGDLNGDGRVDLIGYNTYGQAQAFLNNPSGGFTNTGTVYFPPNIGNVRSYYPADYDNDGHIDLLFSDYFGNLLVNYGRGDGTFADTVKADTFPNPTGVFIAGVADLHGDGKNRVFGSSASGIGIVGGATPVGMPSFAGAFVSTANSFSPSFRGILGDFTGMASRTSPSPPTTPSS